MPSDEENAGLIHPSQPSALPRRSLSAAIAGAASLVALVAVFVLAVLYGGHESRTHASASPGDLISEAISEVNTPEVPAGGVAIIGCGLAGAVTALELISQGYQDITIFEHSPSLFDSTSAMIAATINLDSNYRDWMQGGYMISPLDVITDGFSGAETRDHNIWGDFLGNAASRLMGDPRSDPIQKRKVFRESYNRMKYMVERFPILCEALIGQWCCDSGEEAAAHLLKAGVACPASRDPWESTLGLFQLSDDRDMCKQMESGSRRRPRACDNPSIETEQDCAKAGHGWQEAEYIFYNRNETLARLNGFLPIDTKIQCSLVEHRMSGFARSEVLFSLLPKIFAHSSVTLHYSCDVEDVQPVDDGNKLQVIVEKAGQCTFDGQRDFGQVVVAAAVASVPLLSKVDPKLRANLVGIKGYGLSGGASAPTLPAGQAGRGLHFMGQSARFGAAYVRSTEQLRVKAWGGHDLHASDLGVKPPYALCGETTEDKVFRKGPSCARAIVDLPDTRRMTGMRPVPSVGAVPMIKRYTGPWRNLLLNTGYGYNGYDLAWFASMCTAQWLLQGRPVDPICAAASKVGVEE